MDHLRRVTEEFSRQAQTFANWAEKADDQVAARFGGGLGEAARGNLLDVACGPGIVAAALAPGASSVVAFDATEQMLEKARARCIKAGLVNVQFRRGDAEDLPFGDAQFDGIVTRYALHHIAHPQRALNEMFRVLRRGGRAVIVDIVSSEDAAQSNLHNAIERLRDPSHVRMLSASQLHDGATLAGFTDFESDSWDMDREFEEWLSIVNDADRVAPVRTVVRALAEAGRTAGIGLSIKGERVVFFHRSCLLRAGKP